MIHETVRIERGVLFMSISETEAEAKSLQNLARETRYYASVAKTGLHVALELEHKGHVILVVRLNSPIDLTHAEKLELEAIYLKIVEVA